MPKKPPPEDDDPVGYGKPPTKHQFTKGKSGNPKGRPKGSKNLATIVAREAHAPIRVKRGGKEKTVSTMEATFMALIDRALRGDPRATDRVLAMFERSLQRTGDEAERAQRLTEHERAILHNHIELLKMLEETSHDEDPA